MSPFPPAAERLSSVPGAARRAATLSFRSISIFCQFQQSRSSRAGSEKVKAIKHPVNFQNKTQYSAHVAYHNFTSTLLRHDRWHIRNDHRTVNTHPDDSSAFLLRWLLITQIKHWVRVFFRWRFVHKMKRTDTTLRRLF